MNVVRKSFYASTVEAAIAAARMQLGEDALIVETKLLTAEDVERPGYEVVVEMSPGNDISLAAGSAEPCVDSLLGEISSLRQEIVQVSGLLRHLAAAVYRSHSDLTLLASSLTEAGFSTELSAEILDRVSRRIGYGLRSGPIGDADARRALAVEIESRVKTQPGLGVAVAARKIVVLAGPPGSGKTTTLAKLAAVQSVAAGAPLLVSTDNYRVGAADQLRCYAAILGLPFVQAESPGSLLRVLEENRNKRLILIDTPGYGPRDFEHTREWTRFFASQAEVEVQLVLNASMQARDLCLTAERWLELEPSRLIFTHLDEAASFGGLFSCAIETQLPVSYLCTGQSIPEDIEEASPSLLLSLAAGRLQSVSAAAA